MEIIKIVIQLSGISGMGGIVVEGNTGIISFVGLGIFSCPPNLNPDVV